MRKVAKAATDNAFPVFVQTHISDAADVMDAFDIINRSIGMGESSLYGDNSSEWTFTANGVKFTITAENVSP